MFIVIDGIDGSGKGTQVQRVYDALNSMGKKVKIIDFPQYGSPSCFFVEKYLNGGYGKDIGPELASLFYALDRFDFKTQLHQYLHEFDYVISNRYVSASMIHQAGKIETTDAVDVFLDWLDTLEYKICSIPKPDKVIFLDVPPQISQTLIGTKTQRTYITDGSNKDIHEADDRHLQNAYAKALYVSQKFGWTRIVCSQNGQILSLEEITQKILKEII